MNMNDAILLAAIGLMLYGIAQHFLQGDDFWFSPIGNVIGALGVTVVTGAAYPLTLQDDALVLVAVALGLYWFTKSKRARRAPGAGSSRATFEQIFETVEVEPIVEPKVKAEPVVEQVVEDEPEPVVETIPAPAASPVFVWKGT